MSDLKTKPKIKEKPQSAKHIVKNAPKDVKSIPYNVLSNAPSVMKEQLIKRNSEKQLNDNDEQTPENYATDTIEFAAYSTTSKVYRTMRIIADNRIKSHKIKTKENYTIPNVSVKPNTTNNIQKLANNQPKTLQLTDRKNPTNSSEIRNIPKTVSRTPKMAEDKKIMSKSNIIKSEQKNNPETKMFTPKTKEEYTVAQSETPFAVPEVKQKSIQKSVQKSTAKQKSDIKTKENYIKSHITDTDIKSPDNARHEYVKNKLKSKLTEQQSQNKDVNMPNTPNADITSNAPSVDKPNIKTKENYMQSLRNGKVEPIKTAYKTPKQKTSIVPRQMQTTTSKAVYSKEQITSKTVKNGKNMFKASRIAKKKVSKTHKATVKTQKQVAKQTAKQTAKLSKEAAQRSAKIAKSAVRVATKVAVKVAQAVAKAVKAISTAIASGGAVAVVVVILIVVIIIAAIAASPFGIFISE